VYPVQAGMQFTFDDRIIFGFEGINNGTRKAEWRLLKTGCFKTQLKEIFGHFDLYT
jgi:hypothetical protein